MGIAVMADKAKSLLTSTQMRKALCGSLSVVVIMCFIFMIKLECDTHTIIFCIAILVMFSSSVSSKYFDESSNMIHLIEQPFSFKLSDWSETSHSRNGRSFFVNCFWNCEYDGEWCRFLGSTSHGKNSQRKRPRES